MADYEENKGMRRICREIFGTDQVLELKKIAEKAAQYDALAEGYPLKNVRKAGRKAGIGQQDIDDMIERYRRGESIRMIAEHLGVSRPTVYRYLEAERRMETNPDIVMRMKYMHRDMLCSVIDIDFRHKKVYVTNKTDKILLRAFGVVTEPTWEEFMEFLESRCFPRTRARMKDILRDLGLDHYDPLQIIEKTKGQMAEDHQWIQVIYRDDGR